VSTLKELPAIWFLMDAYSLDHAVENHAKKADGHEILTTVIRGGCKTAIWISERV
jgi:demethoxyubiquinone hydroxylase (CLK1/Coq7/Cat5 family)